MSARPTQTDPPGAEPSARRGLAARLPRAAKASALVGLGALALWWLWPAGAPPEPPPKSGPGKAPIAAAETGAARRADVPPGAGPAAASASPPSTPNGHDEAVARQAKRFEAFEHAIELTRFPPNSRPLTPAMTDVLRPNARHEQPQPLAGGRPAGQKPDPERDLYILFTGPRYAVTPGEPLAATLEVFRGRPDDGHAAPKLALDVRECTLRAPGAGPLAEGLPLNDRGEQGDREAADLTYSIALDPLTLPGFDRHNGPLRLDVAFATPGAGELAHATLDFKLTAAPPARFTGRVAEQLTPQGLALRVGLEVAQPGRYVVQGLLFDARDKPVGFAVDRPQLAAGAGEASLLFFGLLFHEADAQGPFVLRTVTGYRLPEGDEPERLEIAPMAGEYRTHDYPRSAFSNEEWQSASKDRRLDAMRELAEKNPDKTLVSGTPAEPTPAPAPSP